MFSLKNYQRKRLDVKNKEFFTVLNKWKIFKRKLANKLQEKSELLSTQTKRYSLIFFCVLFGGSSIGIIVHSVHTKVNAVKIALISRPAHTDEDAQSMLYPDSVITKQEYNRVLQFENYMFNLKGDSSGRKKYDSILQCRPQLMDSIELFERMYLSQNKK
jgi:hypothetical protein